MRDRTEPDREHLHVVIPTLTTIGDGALLLQGQHHPDRPLQLPPAAPLRRFTQIE